MNRNAPEHQLAALRRIVNVHDLSARQRQVIELVSQPNHIVTSDEQNVLNSISYFAVRRNADVLEAVDSLGSPLCFTVIYRLRIFVDAMENNFHLALDIALARRANGEAVALPERRILRLDDDRWGRGVIAIRPQYVTLVAEFLHIPALTPADIRDRKSYKAKFTKYLRQHYNAVTKEKVEVTFDDEYAVIIKHSDLFRNPRDLAYSGTGSNNCKYMSKMSASQRLKVRATYQQPR